MQLPQLATNKLDLVATEILIELQHALANLRASATEEEAPLWEIALASVEIELWSRGYGPTQTDC